jgi:hypothetical protein
MENLDQDFLDFILGGLEHGIVSVRDSRGTMFPFLMTNKDEVEEVKRFGAKTLGEAIELADQALVDLTPKPQFALIAFDGYFSQDGKKYDAIYVKGFSLSEEIGYEFCQPYIPTQDRKRTPFGKPVFIGKTVNLLYATKPPPLKKLWWKFW